MVRPEGISQSYSLAGQLSLSPFLSSRLLFDGLSWTACQELFNEVAKNRQAGRQLSLTPFPATPIPSELRLSKIEDFKSGGKKFINI